MFIDSERFIKLQNIYQDKAGQDVEMIQKKFLQVLESFGRSFETISEWQEVLQRNKIPEDPERIQREEFSPSNCILNLDDPESDALYYLVVRAVDRYMTQFGNNPGLTDSDTKLDIGRLKTITTSML